MDLIPLILFFVVLLFSLCLHEFAHAWVAYLCGDDTARLKGRMTLNPGAHVDLIGTLILPAIMFFTTGFMFGWAKPVPVNPNNFRRYRRDDMLVSLAGIIANLCLATVGVVGLRMMRTLLEGGVAVPQDAVRLVAQFMTINVILAVFNLIPLPPLDGFQFAKHFLPMRMRWNIHRLHQYGPFILLILLMTGVFQVIFRPALFVFYKLAGIM